MESGIVAIDDAGGEPRAAPAVSESTGAPTILRINGRIDPEIRAFVAEHIVMFAGDAARIPGARVVKAARRRTVARIEAARIGAPAAMPNIYIKQERVLGFANSLRSMAADSHARLEYIHAIQLNIRGVLAPRAVAYAEWRVATFVKNTVSIMEEFPSGIELDAFFTKVESSARAKACAAVAARLAELHARGVDLTDCHKANLLVVPDGGIESLQLALLDLSTVRLRSLRSGARVARLAQLLHSLEPVLDARERKSFIEYYAREANIPAVSVDAFVRGVREGQAAVAMERDRSRDRRCLVQSTEFAVERGLARRVYKRRDAADAEIRGVLAAATAGSGAKLIKKDGRAECYLVPGDVPGAKFIKFIVSNGLPDECAALFRGSRGYRAWKYSHALRRRGISTPRAHALVESGFLLTKQSALVFDAIGGAVTLQEFCANFNDRFAGQRERRRFIEEFAAFIAKIHLSRVDHDDFAIKNFLLRSGRDGWEFFVIDLEAVHSVGRDLEDDRHRRAMMQLDDAPRAVSRADRMRFLTCYEKLTKRRFTLREIAEIRRLLRERFARSKRDYAATGPR